MATPVALPRADEDTLTGAPKSRMQEREAQPSKAASPMASTLAGSVRSSIAVPAKARSDMVAVPWFKAISVRDAQPSKAASPMVRTLPGMLMEVRAVQPSKAFAPIDAMVSGSTRAVSSL